MPIDEVTFYQVNLTHLHISATAADVILKPKTPILCDIDTDRFASAEAMTLAKEFSKSITPSAHLGRLYQWGFNPQHIHIFMDIPRTPYCFDFGSAIYTDTLY